MTLDISIGTISYIAGAALFALFAVLLVTVWRGRLGGRLLMVVCLINMAWAGVLAWPPGTGQGLPLGAVAAAEIVRGLAWIALLWRLVVGKNQAEVPSSLRRLFHGAWISVVAATLVSHLYAFATQSIVAAQVTFIGSGFVLAVAALVLVEQYYRNSSADDRWTIKFFCFAIGGIFAYDIYLFASGLLFMSLDPELWESRGAINALAVPLMALSVARSSDSSAEQFVSRRMVFYSTGLLAVGLYLLVMAAGGYAVRIYGGTWGGFAQILFLCGALVVLAAVLFSGQARARVKVFLNKHFFAYRYDYREEWLKLTRTLAATDGQEPLVQRAIVAVAELVDSPGGALWMRRGQLYDNVALWNMQIDAHPQEPVDSGFCAFLAAREWIVDVVELGARPERYDGLATPAWLDDIDEAWLVIPLLQAQELLGFVLLARSRAMRELTWEDHDLLKTVGRQVAGHLALSESVQLLAETRQFQAYNRLTAFIMHDLKNLIAQQSLVVNNAARHKGNPEFIDDAIATVDNSVHRMNRLLEQLRRGGEDRDVRISRVGAVVREVIKRNEQRTPTPALTLNAEGLRVAAPPESLTMVLGHLLRNAQEATPADGSVSVVVGQSGEEAIIEIRDSGSGMSPAFIRDRLFRPFDTTKGTKGMGIGVYQAREFMMSVGGSLEVESEPGTGSVFRARLPLARAIESSAGREPVASSR